MKRVADPVAETPAAPVVACPGAKDDCLQQVDLNWMLHRAAQQLREALEREALTHGVGIRAQIVLTALVQRERAGQKPLSQLALGQQLGLDKTTMTALLDRLEDKKLLARKADPHDRRARIPQATASGRKLQEALRRALSEVEDRELAALSEHERNTLRDLLHRIITSDRALGPSGSCL